MVSAGYVGDPKGLGPVEGKAVEPVGGSHVEYVVQLEEGVWLADVSGDPGRTLVLGFARRWMTESGAQRVLDRVRRSYPRKFRGAAVVRVLVRISFG